ncbi:S-adenosylmethionine:tRNA ribosyltransferase-isomerase [Peterkaempfera griseoplana]|uniref:S-adenosylmethionine:tRNA ribosyltransferase-isomerase n=1 Tax=Peterkaempfera griseoplana TaxID=66896 RepID=UPI00099E4BE0|nr:S-adenosylmethionine:tRNA ribosyltransferase-isomerase [Peterkaempfera griseoplana]
MRRPAAPVAPRPVGTAGRPGPASRGGEHDFLLPPELEAPSPPEERGTGRDDVRLLVGRRAPGAVSHHGFRELPGLLRPGDVLLVNVSATAPAALDGTLADEPVVVHFSTAQDDGRWTVELRTPDGAGSTLPRPGGPAGAVVRAAGGARLVLEQPAVEGADRLWLARFSAEPGTAALDHLRRHGRPVRYRYTDRDRPLAAYQTVFARGAEAAEGVPAAASAEMPSAARPFTDRMVTALVSRGVLIAPITLHTGVASAESHEPPYPEWFSVPEATARLVNTARQDGCRVVAVGTTAVRALESAAEESGRVRAARGWTDLVVTPERGVRAVDGLLTGLHEPRASHLLMLEAVAGRALVDACYAEALRGRYLWHEFGDLNLMLPG